MSIDKLKEIFFSAVEPQTSEEDGIRTINLCFQAGLPLETSYPGGDIILDRAISNQKPKVALHLLNMGINYEKCGWNAPARAARLGYLDIVKFLLEKDTKKKFPIKFILKDAVVNGQLHVVEYLINNYSLTVDELAHICTSATYDKKLPILKCFVEKYPDIVSYKEYLVLRVAAHNGIQPEVVSYLLSKDIKGMKYIHHTVINENADFFAPFLKVQESSTSTNQNFRIVNVKVQFDDGTIFDGSYVDGKPCEGTLTKTDGTSVYGKFSQDGKFVEGI